MTSASILPDHTQFVGHGIYAIDTGFYRPRYDAAYLVIEAGRAAFIDCGPRAAIPRLLEALEALGVARNAVDWVIPTHVHLDHAGGMGQLMAALPCATLLVHPRGLRHLVDPTQLWAGALAVYGEAEMRRTYGELQPVAPDRCQASQDEQIIELAGRPLVLIDTPGHARHHHCIWDARSRGWFTGDTFGMSFREFDVDGKPWSLPSTTPVQFEPEAMKAAIRRMLERNPAWIFPTHYGPVAEPQRLATLLTGLIDDMVALTRGPARTHTDSERRSALLALYIQSLRSHGCQHSDRELADLLAGDVALNAQGLAIWAEREATR
ncbi:MBL fold metallo-hydrolase [Inhella gelatinilytica]|uniref:MBL fold metallo-hydrolase n=1 Tax=Inhella gelatinilytica TaxID=2795030 RepID=A0A931NCY2_9BURK|nr:MBL fold metallo-hydrolase [Inhella gelatinilytica]MBH9552512.1 MBL fold metallo-hydrolase [Inhella gelatinilytica]